MNIVEATKNALKSGRGITRHKIKQDGYDVWFLPTKTSLGYLIIISDREIYSLWQPSAEDITADDWFVIGGS
ncbi:Thoeris anti-defense Tad2 family protein [Leuconostoc mesenteroides]|uniref:Thoeris anti-defense Tad2 family protein n=1 Tax=Leuconostoc mesenteroides TaxID=1245 RepID=UPI00235E0172|nr:MW1434 family type I TA system toxin [Leuconostoc mesenteroides]